MEFKLLMMLASGLISCFLGLNAFFIRALVQKIEKVDGIEKKIDVHYTQFAEKIENLQRKMVELTSKVQDVDRLKERVAVLEFAQANGLRLKGKTQSPKGGL